MGKIYFAFCITVTIILHLISKNNQPVSTSFLIYLAQLSGLLASTLISLNYILSLRNNFVEKLFNGLDRSYKFHSFIGKTIFILVLAHPLFLILNNLPFNTLSFYLIPSIDNLPYLYGNLAFYSLATLVILTIFVDLPYKIWKKTHEYMGLIVIFASIHGLLITSDISRYLPLKVWIISLNLIGLGCYLYKRFIYYLVRPKENYKINSIKIEKDFAYIEFSSVSKSIKFNPGQFAFFSFPEDKRDEHPISTFESLGGNKISIGIKLTGNFTNKLSKLKTNSLVNIHGPFGSFSENINKNNEMIWISGGIGITPFLTMAESLKKNQLVTMIHSSRSSDSKLFFDKLNKVSKNKPNFKLISHFSDVKGRLDFKEILKYNKVNKDLKIYLCGPKAMMENISREFLDNSKVLKKNIIFEDFSLK